MRVLFVTLFALETNTSVTKSNYGLIKGLQELDCSIDLLMPEINETLAYYDDFFNLSNINIIRIKNNSMSQQIVSASKKITGYKAKIYDILKKLYFKTQIFDRTKALIKKAKEIDVYQTYYDIVISTSDPKTSHLFTAELIKNGLSYGKWIQHWGDPLSGDITKRNIYPEFMIRKIEKNMIGKADSIVYVSPFTHREQKKKYHPLREKMQFAPLPCDPGHTTETEVLINPLNIKMAYLGDYNSSIRDILPLYEAVKCCENIKLIIAGNTDLNLYNTDNITIYPRLPQTRIKEIEDSVDIIVSIGNRRGTQIPGKIYYAASSEKIILVTVDGDSTDEMYHYLNSYGRFICCKNTADDIRKTISALTKQKKIEISAPTQLYPKQIMTQILTNTGMEIKTT